MRDAVLKWTFIRTISFGVLHIGNARTATDLITAELSTSEFLLVYEAGAQIWSVVSVLQLCKKLFGANWSNFFKWNLESHVGSTLMHSGSPVRELFWSETQTLSTLNKHRDFTPPTLNSCTNIKFPLLH